MKRLKSVALFQPLRCGKSKVLINLFTDDTSTPSYPNHQAYAWILLDEDAGLVYIKEMFPAEGMDPYHLTSVNNLQGSKPYEEYVKPIFEEFIPESLKTIEVKPVEAFQFPGVIPNKRMGRPPKVKERSSATITTV